MIDPTAPTRPVPLAGTYEAAVSHGPSAFVGRRARLWRSPHHGYPDGFPFEATILDYRDGLVHVRNGAGKDFWMPAIMLGCIELIDGPIPTVEFKGPAAGLLPPVPARP
jgi:hypothetical protein